MLLWKDGVTFWTLEYTGDALVGVLMEMLQQQRLLLEYGLT